MYVNVSVFNVCCTRFIYRNGAVPPTNRPRPKITNCLVDKLMVVWEVEVHSFSVHAPSSLDNYW